MQGGAKMTDHLEMKPLIHVGFPKCGSTWLQRQVFTREETGFASPWGAQCPLLVEHVKVTDTFLFDEQLDALRAQYEQGFRETAAKGLAPVLSFEHILVDPYGGKADRRESARRLRALFPDAKILMIIREQKGIIQSSYQEHMRRGSPATIERFLGADRQRRLGFGPVCQIETFLYDRLIAYLHEAFGRENVLVLPLEMSREAAFLEKICALVGRAPNDAMRTAAIKREREARKSDYVFLRRLNYIGTSRYVTKGEDTLLRKAAYGLNIALDKVTPDALYQRNRARIGTVIETHVGDFYRESNRAASDLIGVDLGALGYQV
jgi:hypothetical protein